LTSSLPAMPEPVDFFIHVPKTDGTTMLRIIEDRYSLGSVESWYLAPSEGVSRVREVLCGVARRLGLRDKSEIALL
ncbi:MAG: hypothetical protein ABIZ56_03965, partial [Chthoniobacteraceae bacterium]